MQGFCKHGVNQNNLPDNDCPDCEKENHLIDVKRRDTHTIIKQGTEKIRIEANQVREVGCKIARLQWRPFVEKPKEHKRYLCMAHIAGTICFVEHVCLYDKESDRWIYNHNEVEVYCWLDMEFLPEVPSYNELKR